MERRPALNALSCLVSLWISSSCAAARGRDELGRRPVPSEPARSVAIGGTEAPECFEANWKERLAQPYVFVEHHGDYRRLGDSMRRLLEEALDLGLEGGVPFALFFDDPGRVATDALRARACLAIDERPARLGALRYEVLPRAMVVYARVPGAYPEAARSYPALFSYLRELGWQAGGPVREVYLVNPSEVASYDDLVTEVQIPWAAPSE